MHKKRKFGCFPIFLIFFISLVALFIFGVLRIEVFAVTGQVLETTEPNINYVYTNLGTNKYGQPQENYEIINKEYQTDHTIHMYTIGKYPSPGDTINYLRLKFFINWPIYRIIWLNFVY